MAILVWGEEVGEEEEDSLSSVTRGKKIPRKVHFIMKNSSKVLSH